MFCKNQLISISGSKDQCLIQVPHIPRKDMSNDHLSCKQVKRYWYFYSNEQSQTLFPLPRRLCFFWFFFCFLCVCVFVISITQKLPNQFPKSWCRGWTLSKEEPIKLMNWIAMKVQIQEYLISTCRTELYWDTVCKTSNLLFADWSPSSPKRGNEGVRVK